MTEDHGKRMEFDGVVTKHEPPRLSAVHLTGPYFDIDAEYFFDDIGGGTRVTQRSSVEAKGLFKLLFLMFGWVMKKSGCKAAQNELENLKRILEEPGDTC